MPTSALIALVVVLWVAIGWSAALFLGRRGYRDPQWYFLGAVLGPLFVPMALERGRRQHRVVERTPRAEGSPPPAEGAVTAVVGVDGSAESDRAVRDAARLFPVEGARVVLVMAVDPDVVEFSDETEQDRCRALLDDRAGWFPRASPVVELVAGQPGSALLDVARQEGADVVVVGRRGRGLSHRVLGSVAEHVTHHSPVPVLLAGPAAG
ncbi:universal stress protein [Blastococcus sp. VKM Ac-2987]|uniref:universal stress protein n=1 Tax=Blastococcus sp. VKM Ac-2987 TaxID=3004141 RepID=UPI0022AB7006|nr:universal stress protein [Blastococcus sp. VKM Ac-2987]MCZ2861186.1 universal stress protein [Blastococcus sp. VKM Ac-2987]